MNKNDISKWFQEIEEEQQRIDKMQNNLSKLKNMKVIKCDKCENVVDYYHYQEKYEMCSTCFNYTHYNPLMESYEKHLDNLKDEIINATDEKQRKKLIEKYKKIIEKE